MGDVTLAGYTLTRDEWEHLDDDTLRAFLEPWANAAANDRDEAYAAYEIWLQPANDVYADLEDLTDDALLEIGDIAEIGEVVEVITISAVA